MMKLTTLRPLDDALPATFSRRDLIAGATLLSVAALAEPAKGSTVMPSNHPLIANGPHPSLGHHADTFGRIIGSWAGQFWDKDGDVERRGEMEVHLYWVLDGRAVQDVWITPSRNILRGTGQSPLYFGSTMRIFDVQSESWRMFWYNPVQPYVRGELIGKRVGDSVVQLGSYGDTPIKWVFEDITANSFVWRGYWMGSEGVDWTLNTEFSVKRV